MAFRSGEGTTDLVTSPDRIDREALSALQLLAGERVRRVWRTGRGYLVMTNLRCVEVGRKEQVFSTGDWELGPSFFFYNLGPPKVVLGHYLRLSEEHERHAVAVHVFFHEAYAIAEEIEAAREAGRSEWLLRRAQVEAASRASEARALYEGRGVVYSVAKMRCDYCGNLMSVTATVCPSCGAPHP